jgi:hypothetical protein
MVKATPTFVVYKNGTQIASKGKIGSFSGPVVEERENDRSKEECFLSTIRSPVS